MIIFNMQTGFGMLESGCVSLKNEVNIMMKNVCDVILGYIIILKNQGASCRPTNTSLSLFFCGNFKCKQFFLCTFLILRTLIIFRGFFKSNWQIFQIFKNNSSVDQDTTVLLLLETDNSLFRKWEKQKIKTL